MDYYERCFDVFCELEKDARNWGKFIDDFLYCYKQLSLEERAKLRNEIPSKNRYVFMSQYLGHVRRNYKGLAAAETEELLRNLILMISLDNYEWDYRETIMRAKPLFEGMPENTFILKKIWDELREQCPEKTQHELDRWLLPSEWNNYWGDKRTD